MLRGLVLTSLLAQPGCSFGDGAYVPTGGGAGPSTAATGLPCEVKTVLSTYCWSCHGTTPTAGAPLSLVTRDDLTRPSPIDPTMTVAERSLMRMRGDPTPMPPATAPTMAASDIDAIDAWISEATPAGTCDGSAATDAGGTGPDPFAVAPTCTSGSFFNGGEGPDMRPGEPCITCHAQNGAPDFLAAGTVFPTGHEPDDCEGVNGQVTVRITDATGRIFDRLVNAVGNFSVVPAAGPMTLPITAKVMAGGRERVMATPADRGDCNSCHTQDGAENAPGRIVAP